jgi:hypothetical protein
LVQLDARDLPRHVNGLIHVSGQIASLAFGVTLIAVAPAYDHFFDSVSGFFDEVQQLDVKGGDFPAARFFFVPDGFEVRKVFQYDLATIQLKAALCVSYVSKEHQAPQGAKNKTAGSPHERKAFARSPSRADDHIKALFTPG